MTETITLAPPRNRDCGVSAAGLLRRLRQAGAGLLDRLAPPARRVTPLPPEWFNYPPI